MEKKWCVYVHIAPNGKKYVGITSQKPEKRWNHGEGYQRHPYFYFYCNIWSGICILYAGLGFSTHLREPVM